jgi:hypothetical protein
VNPAAKMWRDKISAQKKRRRDFMEREILCEEVNETRKVSKEVMMRKVLCTIEIIGEMMTNKDGEDDGDAVLMFVKAWNIFVCNFDLGI